MSGSKFEKAVAVIAIVLAVLFIGFAFYGHVNLDILEDPPEENIQPQDSVNTYSTSTNIRVERTLEGQDDLTERANIKVIVNQNDEIARMETRTALKRAGSVIKTTNNTEYIIDNQNLTGDYDSEHVAMKELPTINLKILDSFTSTKDGTRTTFESEETEFIGLIPHDISQFSTSNEFETVKYDVRVDDRDRIRSYKVTAESSTEEIVIQTDYVYHSGDIQLDTLSKDGYEVTYSLEGTSDMVDVYSTELNSTETLPVERNQLTLVRGKHIVFSGVDLINIQDNDTNREHLITDEFVIKSTPF